MPESNKFEIVFLVEESEEFLGEVVDPPTVLPTPPEIHTNTKLHPPSSAAYFTYNRVSWKLNVRKEVRLYVNSQLIAIIKH
jgi:hypothetical protein